MKREEGNAVDLACAMTTNVILCDHGEPTVLKTLNGRKVYVCAKYPHHHCTKWCPADVLLVDTEIDGGDRSLLGTQALSLSAEQQQQASPAPKIATQANNNEPQQPSPAEGFAADNGTPRSQQVTSPAVPPAPTKSQSHGSSTSKIPGPGVRRSLTQTFNRFSNSSAAMRANLLGARYSLLRPQAQSIVQMQRRLSGKQLSADLATIASETAVAAIHTYKKPEAKQTPMSPPEISTAATVSGLKRQRTTEGTSGGFSVKTVSLSKEQRAVKKGPPTKSMR